jgi:hypothetical protein
VNVLHDDAKRDYAYGPAQGLPDTKVGACTPTQAGVQEASQYLHSGFRGNDKRGISDT